MLVLRPSLANRRSRLGVFCAVFLAFACVLTGWAGSISAAGPAAPAAPAPATPAPSAPAEGGAVANDARIGGDLSRTRFVADLSDEVDFRVFALSDPYRVIVDLPEVKFLMPSGVGSKGKGLVSAFRYGLFAAGKSRIVIDVVEPVRIEKAFLRKAENDQPARLVIDLVRTTKEEFDQQRNKQVAFQSPGLRSFETETEKISPDTAKPDKKTKSVIVIDPGHGGVDPGAISAGGVYEKNVVFAFAQVLKPKLEATGLFKVVMTRSEDIFIPLPDRVERARAEQADLLISIHADALDTRHPLLGAKVAPTEVRGASIYTLSEEAARHARR
jgi:N-acetylmuramoyl-L-alanine amidase